MTDALLSLHLQNTILDLNDSSKLKTPDRLSQTAKVPELRLLLLLWIFFAVGKQRVGALAAPIDVECGSRCLLKLIKKTKTGCLYPDQGFSIIKYKNVSHLKHFVIATS